MLDDGDTVLNGDRFLQLWVDRVPEAKVVKNRVHLDLYVPDIDALVALGATVLASHDEWSVLGDPEGNEFCAFPPERVVDVPAAAVRPLRRQRRTGRAGGVVAGPPRRDDGPGSDGRPRWLHEARGLGDLTLKFVPVDRRAVGEEPLPLGRRHRRRRPRARRRRGAARAGRSCRTGPCSPTPRATSSARPSRTNPAGGSPCPGRPCRRWGGLAPRGPWRSGRSPRGRASARRWGHGASSRRRRARSPTPRTPDR